MIITTKFLEDDLFEAENETGQSTRYDMRNQDVKKNLSPVESLLGSLCTCIGGDVVEILKKRRKTVNGLTIVADGDRKETHPRAILGVDCKMILNSPDANMEEFTKAGELVLAKYCSVASSINSPVNLSFEIIRD